MKIVGNCLLDDFVNSPTGKGDMVKQHTFSEYVISSRHTMKQLVPFKYGNLKGNIDV